MAAEGEAPTTEIRTHERGYFLFTRVMMWGALASFIAAMAVVFLISS
jgi:Bacterial aa3 type cytochrome c oxidase subunit IV